MTVADSLTDAGPVATAGRSGARRARRFGLYALLVLVAVIAGGPLYWLISSALKTNPQIYSYPPHWIPTDLRWSNFSDAWSAAPFGRFFLNSLIVSVIGTAIELTAALLCAYAFVFLPFPGKKVLFLFLLGAMMVPGHVTLLPNFLTIAQLGWVNSYAGLIAPGLGSVFGTFLLRQHMLTLPQEITDAAKIDGAGHLRILFRVVLPMSRPMVITVALVVLVGKWNDFIWPLIVTSSADMRTLPIGLLFLKNTETFANWGAILAGAVMVIVPVLGMFFFAQRYIIAGLTQGAGK
ncbi:carbohydrate ABC transporter permease [Streptomyces sp. NBC_01020]|uniref:carbohydrate ABC transporter permease n=1 Tax=unclassified Streptomyces TaxID=2593676 RepID=UPI003870233A|nr:carbohydrate ABC transporter permease [Streptomyces sp. NBC_01020]WSX71258.1 carbohydrate ABC transporter permease [Streptomyces sp. NBC_00932]